VDFRKYVELWWLSKGFLLNAPRKVGCLGMVLDLEFFVGLADGSDDVGSCVVA
jgi:hypothetical protein